MKTILIALIIMISSTSIYADPDYTPEELSKCTYKVLLDGNKVNSKVMKEKCGRLLKEIVNRNENTGWYNYDAKNVMLNAIDAGVTKYQDERKSLLEENAKIDDVLSKFE